MSTLAVSELTVSHFRSHKRAKLSLQSGPVAIFGANGAGKTNLLEAISFLSPGRGLRRATMGEIARRSEYLGWKVSVVLTSLGRTYEVETWAEPGNPRKTRIDGKAATQTTLGGIARVLWLVPSMDRLWTEGAEGRRRFLDRMSLSFAPSHGQVVISYEKAMRDRNRLLKDHVDDPSWFGALEQHMAESGAEIMTNRYRALERIAAAQDGAKTHFPSARLSLQDPDGGEPISEVDALLEEFSNGRVRDIQAGRTLTGPHRCDLGAIYSAKDTPARQCSTGEQKALLISLILANARALSNDFGAPPILLLDEVAAHLDTTRRAALYDEVGALGAQAFLTGTGPELFQELDGKSQMIEIKENNGVSEVHIA